MGGGDRCNSKVWSHGESPSGYPMQSPYIGIANRQAELMIRLASEFGFTPASRSRISSPQELPLLTLFGPHDQL
jgi:phage terminase small subunit